MARLEFLDATGNPASILIGQQHRRITIGRNPESDISTTNQSVSRNHGEINLRGGVFVLQDMDSSNGTMLNGQEIRPFKLMVLQDGDLVSCGEFEIRFRDDGQDDLLASPPPAEVPPAVVAGAGAGQAQAAAVQPAEPFGGRRRQAVPPPADPLCPGQEPAYGGAGLVPPGNGFAAAAEAAPVQDDRRAGRVRRPPPPDPLVGGAAVAQAAAPPLVAPVVLQAPPPVAIPGMAVDASAELAQLRGRVAELEELIRYYEAQGTAADQAALEADRQKLAHQLEERTIALEEATANVADLNQRIGEIESKIRRQEVEIENHVEKQLDLREQMAHQASQITDLRKELSLRDHQIEDLQFELRTVREKADVSTAGLGDKDREINNLKAEYAQKSRMIDELQRQLDVTTYDLQQAREHLEQVTSEYSGTGGEVDVLRRKIANLQEIISDKDQRYIDKEEELREALDELDVFREEDRGGTSAKLAQLRNEAERLHQESELQQGELLALREELRNAQSAASSGSAAASRDRELVNQLKRDNRDLRRQVDELEAQLASGRPAGGGGGGEDGAQLATLRAQVEDLEEENKLLEERIARLSRRTQTVSGEQGGGDAEAKTENRKLKQQVDELQEQLAAARQAQQQVKGGGGLSAATRASLGQAYEQLNALAA
ncbi:MAG: FHA domain-containing protein, partial [Deltaproteobacteria bacterium]|nr:FHA domain-containing protein [Deltaproteobacteria bacterium]